jgi:hypothetical protein
LQCGENRTDTRALSCLQARMIGKHGMSTV